MNYTTNKNICSLNLIGSKIDVEILLYMIITILQFIGLLMVIQSNISDIKYTSMYSFSVKICVGTSSKKRMI